MLSRAFFPVTRSGLGRENAETGEVVVNPTTSWLELTEAGRVLITKTIFVEANDENNIYGNVYFS